MNNNILVTMSGGTTTVINATLAGMINEIKETGFFNKIYAGTPGISGVMSGRIKEIPLNDRLIEMLKYTPASGFIGTTRVKPLNMAEVNKFIEVLYKHNINYFVNIGGNGTIKQSIGIAEKTKSNIVFASLPKTVDNDLGDREFKQVLYTPGFPSCANYWRHKIHIFNQENLGACSHDKVLVVQTFGRETGFLAGCARLADPQRKLPLLILIPEDQRSLEELMERVRELVSKKGRAIIVICEGYRVGNLGERLDPSGQIMYGSSRQTAAQLLVNLLLDNNIQSRPFIPGPDQRSDIRFSTTLDINRSFKLGTFMVRQLINGKKSFLASIAKSNVNTNAVRYTSIDYKDCLDFSRTMPQEWIDWGNFDVTDEYLRYVNPLIGDREVKYSVNKLQPIFPTSLLE